VSNAGTGPAGILQIRANSIFLDNQAGITASTASGEGGNIQLQVRDLLLLRDNSGVFAIAGGTGNGGNVTIDASSIVAIPRENIAVLSWMEHRQDLRNCHKRQCDSVAPSAKELNDK
jgi:large exoprotein involved in heme utilization and adhesion